MSKSKREKRVDSEKKVEKEYFYSICGQEITKDEYDDYDGMCWECRDDQLTEESDCVFGDLM